VFKFEFATSENKVKDYHILCATQLVKERSTFWN